MFGKGLQQKRQTVGQERWPTCEFSVSGVAERLHPHSLELTHSLTAAQKEKTVMLLLTFNTFGQGCRSFFPKYLHKLGELSVITGFIVCIFLWNNVNMAIGQLICGMLRNWPHRWWNWAVVRSHLLSLHARSLL